MMFFALLVSEDASETTVRTTKILILVYWIVSLLAKAYVHYLATVKPFEIKGRKDPRDLITRIVDFIKKIRALPLYNQIQFAEGIMYRLFGLLAVTGVYFSDFSQGILAFLLRVEQNQVTVEVTRSISALFTNVAAAVGLPYMYGVFWNKTSLIDLSCVWRITWVLTGILVTIAVGQNPYPGYNFMRIPIIVDVGLAFLVLIFVSPGGPAGAIIRLRGHFFVDISPVKNRWIHVEGFLGIILGIMATCYAAASSDEPLAAFTVSIPVVFYMFLMWASKDNDKTSIKASFAARLVMLGSIVIQIRGYEFLVLPHMIYAVTMTLGIIRPSLGLLGNSVGILYYYTLGFQGHASNGQGIFCWVSLWAAITYAVSHLWINLFWSTYTAAQQRRIMKTHRQDTLLCLFEFAVTGVLHRAGALAVDLSSLTIWNALAVDYAGFSVGYFVPLGVLWFTLETKFMTHIWVGSPYHASWWGIGDPPGTTPGSKRYAWTNAVNWTFGFIGAVMTFVVVLFAAILMILALNSKEALLHPLGVDSDLPLWKYAGTHGIVSSVSSSVSSSSFGSASS